ncbi:MAG: HAD family hydrolase [Rhodospirillales bacterium]|nr:HAD family hydrolase [Rhodospirillales bacterium]
MSRFPLDSSGLWREVRAGRSSGPAPALFLDRDGTLIELVDYLCRADEVAPIPGAFESLAQAAHAGLRVVIVTNQSGIDRGYYGWDAFAQVQERVIALADAAGGRIDAVYACPALPGSGAACRKPAPGMIHAAAADLGIDLGASWIVGDAASDLEAGRRAGLARGWLVPTGYGARDRSAASGLARGNFRVTIGRPIAALGAALAADRA